MIWIRFMSLISFVKRKHGLIGTKSQARMLHLPKGNERSKNRSWKGQSVSRGRDSTINPLWWVNQIKTPSLSIEARRLFCWRCVVSLPGTDFRRSSPISSTFLHEALKAWPFPSPTDVFYPRATVSCYWRLGGYRLLFCGRASMKTPDLVLHKEQAMVVLHVGRIQSGFLH